MQVTFNFSFISTTNGPGMVAFAYNLHIQEADETELLQVGGQPGLHSKVQAS